MYWITVSVMTTGAAAFLVWRFNVGAGSSKRRSPVLWAGVLAVPLVALSIERLFLADDRLINDSSSTFVLPAGLDSIAWPGSAPVMPASPPITWKVPDEPATSAASVSSLVDGLETRLASEPGDSKGWALLAQSYAFLGDGQHAETAISKAVELGFDEADLRHRVELANAD